MSWPFFEFGTFSKRARGNPRLKGHWSQRSCYLSQSARLPKLCFPKIPWESLRYIFSGWLLYILMHVPSTIRPSYSFYNRQRISIISLLATDRVLTTNAHPRKLSTRKLLPCVKPLAMVPMSDGQVWKHDTSVPVVGMKACQVYWKSGTAPKNVSNCWNLAPHLRLKGFSSASLRCSFQFQ